MRIFLASLLGLPSLLWSAIDFNSEVRPVLSNNCFFCHGPDGHERKADLRLDTEEGATNWVAKTTTQCFFSDLVHLKNLPRAEIDRKLIGFSKEHRRREMF